MDKELLKKLRGFESFTEEERLKIYALIDMAISYHKTKKGIFQSIKIPGSFKIEQY